MADSKAQGMSAGGGPAGGEDTETGVAHAGNKVPRDTLRVTVSDPEPAGDGGSSQWRLPIVFTNRSGAACEVRGFPGVRLAGVDGTTWDLVRTNARIRPVVLRPGEHTEADLTFLPDQSAAGWEIANLAVTPQNTTGTQVLTWPLGKIVKQDAATHPGTCIDPVQPGSAKY